MVQMRRFCAFDVQPGFDCCQSGTHLPELQGASCSGKCSNRHDDIHSVAIRDHVSCGYVNRWRITMENEFIVLA